MVAQRRVWKQRQRAREFDGLSHSRDPDAQGHVRPESLHQRRQTSQRLAGARPGREGDARRPISRAHLGHCAGRFDGRAAREARDPPRFPVEEPPPGESPRVCRALPVVVSIATQGHHPDGATQELRQLRASAWRPSRRNLGYINEERQSLKLEVTHVGAVPTMTSTYARPRSCAPTPISTREARRAPIAAATSATLDAAPAEISSITHPAVAAGRSS